MSDWIIIPKPHLRRIAKMLPDVAALLQKLEIKYDLYPGKELMFFIIPSQFHENMEIRFNEFSLDWNLGVLLTHYIAKFCPRMPQADQEHIGDTLHDELSSKMGTIMHANVRQAVEREAKHDKPPVLNSFGSKEAAIIMPLFTDAQAKAADIGLNAIQLFLEGKLDRLMQGDPRLDDYNRLSDDKKKQLRQNFIETNGWETFYAADDEPDGLNSV